MLHNSQFPECSVRGIHTALLDLLPPARTVRAPHLSIGPDLSRVCWAGPLISVHKSRYTNFKAYMYIVLFYIPRHPTSNKTSQHGSHSDGRRDTMPKGLDVGEMSIMSAVVRYTFGLVCG